MKKGKNSAPKIYIPIEPARGEAEVALGFIYRTRMRRAPARPVHACCANLLHCCCPPASDHVATQRQANLVFTLHTALFTTHTSHFALHTSSHLISALLISSEHSLINLSPRSSSPLISALLHARKPLLSERSLLNPKNHCRQKTFPHRSLGHRCIYTEKPLQNTLYRKACTKQFLVLLYTTKLAPSAPEHYFVQQSLRKVGKFLVLLCASKLAQSRKVPSTTLCFKACTKHVAVLLCTSLCYKACTKYFPVLLCTTKFAQSVSQYYFVLQSLHKVLASTTLYYKACTKYFLPVLLCTTKLAQSTSSITLYYKACTNYFLAPSFKACTQHVPVRLCTTKTKLAQSTSQY